jgi:hypothetical protein
VRRRLAAPLVLVAALALAAAPGREARAEELRIEVLADRSQPAADDVVRLTYKLSGGGLSGDIKPPATLPLKNLALAGGPSRSDQVSFVNGVFSRSLGLTYYLRPKGPGPAEVGETVWGVGDKTLKAAPYLFEVGPATGRGGATASPDEPEDPFAALFPNRGAPRPGPGIGPGIDRRREAPLVEVLVMPDKTTAYVGEEITVTVDLVTSSDVQGLEWIEPPKFPGAWAEDLERPERPTGRRDVVENRPVMRFTLLKKLVSGLAPGTLTIPPVKIRTSVRTAGDPSGEPFGFFFHPQRVELSSKPVALKILPIPSDRAFSGPVGRFDLTARVDKTRVGVGEAATLRVRLAGPGSLRTATQPPRVSIENAKVYPPTSRTEPPRSGKPGWIEWEYVFVPTAPGEITIPPVSLETFDTSEKRIVARASAPLRLVAEGGAPALVAAAPGIAGAAPATAETTLPTPPAATKPATPAETSPPGPALDLSNRTVTLPLWLLVAVPGAAIALAGTLLLARRRRTPRVDLKEALAPEPGETKERAAARIDRALRDGLERRHGVPEGATTAVILSALEEKGFPGELRQDTERLLADLDFLRFAPQLGDYAAKIAEVREEASRLLPRLF